jgi:hypothetical protein
MAVTINIAALCGVLLCSLWMLPTFRRFYPNGGVTPSFKSSVNIYQATRRYALVDNSLETVRKYCVVLWIGWSLAPGSSEQGNKPLNSLKTDNILTNEQL